MDPDDSAAYRTADEDSSRYFSMLAGGSNNLDDDESSVDGHDGQLVIDDQREEDSSCPADPRLQQPPASTRAPTTSQLLKSDSYNFPEGSHCVTIQVDGDSVEAINIGQDIYIYNDADGDLRAFQIMSEAKGEGGGAATIKNLHVGKKEDGSIEVYEEEVNHVPIQNDKEPSPPKQKDPSEETKASSTPPRSETTTYDDIPTLSIKEEETEAVLSAALDQNPTVRNEIENILEHISKVSEVESESIETTKEEVPKTHNHNNNFAAANDLETIKPNAESNGKEIDSKDEEASKEKMVEESIKETDRESSGSMEPEKSCNDSQSSILESDDENEDVVEGEPVTGDCEEAWNSSESLEADKKPIPIAPINNENSSSEKESIKRVFSFADIPSDTSDNLDNLKISPIKALFSQSTTTNNHSDSDAASQIQCVDGFVPGVPNSKARSKTENSDAKTVCYDSDDSFSINPKTYAVKTYSKEKKPKSSRSLVDKFMSGEESDAGSASLDSSPFTTATQSVPKEIYDYTKSNGSKSLLKKVDKSDSQKHKHRTPRKQVFAPVPSSDIEIIFPRINADNDDRHSDSDETFVPPKMTTTCLSPKNFRSLRSRSSTKESQIPDENMESIESVVENHNKVPEVASKNDSTEPSLTVKENVTKTILENSFNATQESEASPKKVAIPEVLKTPKGSEISSNSLSSSSRRKPGRPPKKIITLSSESFECLIAQTIENSAEPKELNSVESKKDIEDSNVSDLEKKQSIVQSKESKSENSTPKKVGRPKKDLSSSLCFDSSPPKKLKSRLSLPNLHSNDSPNKMSEDENVCPLCLKTFRSSNVLFKHAKHCNGVIEFVKLTRKKRTVDKKEVSLESEIKENLSLDSEVEKKVACENTKVESNESVKSPINIEKPIASEKRDQLPSDNVQILKPDHPMEIEKPSDKDTNVIDRSDIVVDNDVDKNDKQKRTESESISIDDSVIEESISESANVPKSSANENAPKNSDSKNTKETSEAPTVSARVPDKETKEIKPKAPIRMIRMEIKKPIVASPMSRLSKILKSKAPAQSKPIQCEICKKTFRQLAHMVSHRKQHEREVEKKDVPAALPETAPQQSVAAEEPPAMMSCEICKKGFRKLHHLVQHREMHAAAANRIESRRTSAASSVRSEGGFRCDTCEKSFRKLHHLVQHREMHSEAATMDHQSSVLAPIPEDRPEEAEAEGSTTCSGCGKGFRKRHHMIEHRDNHCSPSKKRKEGADLQAVVDSNRDVNVRLSIGSSTSDDSGYSCGVCGKSYRKLHHMVEHRESHANDASAKPDVLSTKDIIHECPRCYMVFPNVNALDKHVGPCMKKKKLVRKSLNVQRSVDSQSLSIRSKRKSSESIRSSVSERPASVKAFAQAADPKEAPSKIPAPKRQRTEAMSQKVVQKESDSDDEVNIRYSFSKEHDSQQKPAPVKRKSLSSKERETILEEMVYRYSFPATPKSSEANISTVDLTTPKSAKKVVVTKKIVRKSIGRIPVKAQSSAKAQMGVAKRHSVDKRKTLIPKAEPTETEVKRPPTKEPHKCDCGKAFNNDALLKRHMDAEHTPPKSFNCRKCEATFRTAAQFAKHKSVHEQEEKRGGVASGSSATEKAKKVLKMDESKPKKGVAAAPAAPSTAATASAKKKRKAAAHGGVPLSEKMRKAIANAKF